MNAFWKGVTALLVIAVVVSLVTLFGGSRPVGSENLIDRPLPAFAAPLALGELDGDANVFTEAQAEAEDATAACDVTLPDAFNSCKELDGRAIIVFWNATKPECIEQVNVLQDVVAQNPKLNVVAVAFNNSKPDVAEVVRRQGWTLPVAVDRDGAVASLYAVTGCPSVFWSEDQQTTTVKLGTQTAKQLLEPFETNG
ncbi:MAG: peroxiredoxin family protein [Solirubrobacterales bacterium]